MAKRKVLPNGEADPNARALPGNLMFSDGTFSNTLGGLIHFDAQVGRIVYTPVALPQHALRVEDLLARIHFPIRSMGFRIRGGRVVPQLTTNMREDGFPTYLSGYSAELRGSPKEKIAAARQCMLDLLAHEVDEWLYMAGLGDDPHACWNAPEHARLNDIYEKGTAQL